MTVLYPQKHGLASLACTPGISYPGGLTNAPPVGTVIVCTDGTWSVVVPFVPCDDFRITIDGPAADQVKISATIELQE